jgi:predicted PhzF superfamily epimerase YddE/YHI9
MADIPLYQLDAFSERVFGGNPAAICPLDAWIDEALMQSIAAENNLSETAFFVPAEVDGKDGYALRWFTPTAEIDLCGHATLASAWVVFNRLAPGRTSVSFSSCSGTLTVEAEGDLLFMDFPVYPRAAAALPDVLAAGLGATPAEAFSGPNWMVVLDSAEQVRALDPDMAAIASAHPRCVIVTAPGGRDGDGDYADCDFVSRFFAPSYGIPEDPVTGSAHCTLTPYWAERLGRKRLEARQISARGGVLICEDRGDRVGIGGRASLFMEGSIRV